MYLPIEDFKDFLALIETEEDKAGVPIFIGKNQVVTKEGMSIGEVIIQYQYDTEMLVVFKTSEGIDPVMVPSPQLFNLVEYYTDKETAKKVQEKSKEMLANQEKKVSEEYEKAVQVLKDKGFESIVPTVWSQ